MVCTELRQKAEQKCLCELRAFFSSNPVWEPIAPFIDDKVLLHFVRGRKCNFKKAAKSLENYIESRRVKYPALFKPMRPSNNACLKSGAMRVLKHRDSSGRAIVVIRAAKWNPSEVSPDDFIRAVIMTGEEMAESEQVEYEGFVLIADATGVGWSHLQLWKNPFEIHKALDIVFTTSPLRYNGIHLVNMSFLPNQLINLVYHLLPAKLKKRVTNYSRSSSGLAKFHESISPSVLPESLGGKLTEEQAFDIEFEQRIYAKEDFYEKVSALI